MQILEFENLEKDKNILIKKSENKYDNQIENIVSKVKGLNKRILLLSGPSGSGKTTTAKRIVKRLKEKGVESVYLSMDNWFRTKSEYTLPLDEKGRPDYESPLCVDIKLLNEDLEKLLNGDSINLPLFDFVNEIMTITDKTLKLKSDNSILVLEGLHALNTYVNVNREYSYKVYVCPEDLYLKDNIKIFQEEIRLYRRITRDSLHRGRDLEKTVELYETVSRGEKLYLNPFKYDIDSQINSLLDYEIFLHKTVLNDYDKLNIVPALNIGVNDIPKGSIMNEFYKR